MEAEWGPKVTQLVNVKQRFKLKSSCIQNMLYFHSATMLLLKRNKSAIWIILHSSPFITPQIWPKPLIQGVRNISKLFGEKLFSVQDENFLPFSLEVDSSFNR